jgi:TolB-like protein/Tfp pilus assembly protein PilF
MSILEEVKRRKIFQVAAVYLVVAWLVMQVVDVIDAPLRLPGWFPTVVIVLLAIGFPFVLIVSWAFNVTPSGVVRDIGNAPSSSSRTIEFALIGLVAVAVMWLIYRTEFDTSASRAMSGNMIAVLPFENLSPDPNNAFFAAGIHDTILNELAKIDELDVISRTTMMRYAGTTKSMPEIANELGAGKVLEGTVQFAGGQVRVTAQLIDPATDSHIWSSIYDRDFADIFEIQADIATRIAAAMDAELTPQEHADIRAKMTESPVAQARYWEAMELIEWDFSPGDSMPEVHRLLDEAIEHDPNFALAYATKANIYAYNRHELDLAIRYAEKAIEIDSYLGSAYGALASVRNRQMRDDEAIVLFEKALLLSPNDIDILDNFSRQRSWHDDPDAQLELAARVLAIDPARIAYFASVQWNAGFRDDALETIRRAAINEPDDHQTQIRAALYETQMGNAERAQPYLAVAVSLQTPEAWSLNALAQNTHRYGLIGASSEAEKLYSIFVERATVEPDGTISPALWMRACLGIRDRDCIRDWFDRTIEEVRGGYRPVNAAFVANNNWSDPILDEPEYVELRRQLGYDVPGL